MDIQTSVYTAASTDNSLTEGSAVSAQRTLSAEECTTEGAPSNQRTQTRVESGHKELACERAQRKNDVDKQATCATQL